MKQTNLQSDVVYVPTLGYINSGIFAKF